MELKLRELLYTIDSRFSGPASCRLNDMLSGKLDFDYEEIQKYLIRLKGFDDIHKNNNRENDRKDAEAFLNLFNQYLEERDKRRE